MYCQMYDSYHEAADRNHCLIADVGQAFYQMSESMNLYADDGCHPNEMGSKIAAEVIAQVITAEQKEKTRNVEFVIHC